MKNIKEEINKKFDSFYNSNDVVFIKRPHGYKLNGKTCAGVSTVSEFAPKDYLKFWAAKMVVKFLKDKQKMMKDLTASEYKALLKEAENQHAKRSKDAMDIGTRVHDWVENHIKGEYDLGITADIENPIKEFLDFLIKYKIEWIAVEKIVGSLEHLVAGRLDTLAIIDGKMTLVDLKTSNMIDENYFLQTAGYQMCLEEMGIKVDQRIILRLPKKKEDGFEAVLVNSDYEKDKEAFLHRRYSFLWANYIDVNFKESVMVNGYRTRKLKLKKL